MRLTIQFDSQAAKISAVQASRVCSSGWALSQSSQPARSSVMVYSIDSFRAGRARGGGTIAKNQPVWFEQRPPPRFTRSADEFAADRLEQIGTGALHPFERDHFARDDLRAGLTHALQCQFLVRGASRADRFLDHEYLIAVRQQVEHGLHDADMGFTAAN